MFRPELHTELLKLTPSQFDSTDVDHKQTFFFRFGKDFERPLSYRFINI